MRNSMAKIQLVIQSIIVYIYIVVKGNKPIKKEEKKYA